MFSSLAGSATAEGNKSIQAMITKMIHPNIAKTKKFFIFKPKQKQSKVFGLHERSASRLETGECDRCIFDNDYVCVIFHFARPQAFTFSPQLTVPTFLNLSFL